MKRIHVCKTYKIEYGHGFLDNEYNDLINLFKAFDFNCYDIEDEDGDHRCEIPYDNFDEKLNSIANFDYVANKNSNIPTEKEKAKAIKDIAGSLQLFLDYDEEEYGPNIAQQLKDWFEEADKSDGYIHFEIF